jgi:hypothetical protein
MSTVFWFHTQFTGGIAMKKELNAVLIIGVVIVLCLLILKGEQSPLVGFVVLIVLVVLIMVTSDKEKELPQTIDAISKAIMGK